MTTEPHNPSPEQGSPPSIEMPVPTVWPFVLSFGILLIASGVALGLALSAVGFLIFLVGLVGWLSQLMPGQGLADEPLAPAEQRPRQITPVVGKVEQLKPGMPGYRFRLPEKIRPISAGVRGGLVGGLLMPIPAVLWGLIAHGSLFYPVNLLAGLMLPGLQEMTYEELIAFQPLLFVVGVLIHVVVSLSVGLMYGVMMPTLPKIPRPLAWGGLLLPLMWSAVSFVLMEVVNPALNQHVAWVWFIFSQFIFGVAAALTVMRAEKLPPLQAGAVGGVVGGLLMPVPAVLWSLFSGHGMWLPINLLAGTVLPGLGGVPVEELRQFNGTWFATALVIHAVFSIGFGLVYGFALSKLPEVPGPLSWGGVLMPLLWTGGSYGLMGVMNPVLKLYVDWPWFIVSQFVFGVAAALVVLRSAQIPIPPAGPGPQPETKP